MRTSKRMFAFAAALSVVLGAAWWFEPPVSAEQRSGTGLTDRTARAIAALNDCIQERFKEVDERFGFRRVIKIGETPHRFEPENVREMDAVRGLEGARLRVVLYLASRPLVTRTAPPSGSGDVRVYRRIKGPVQITPIGSHDVPAATSLPPATELWDDSQRAVLAFAEQESHEFAKGDWKFTARPVRVSDAVCLSCHRSGSASMFPTEADGKNSLRLGDPLGVVMYGYRPVQ